MEEINKFSLAFNELSNEFVLSINDIEYRFPSKVFTKLISESTMVIETIMMQKIAKISADFFGILERPRKLKKLNLKKNNLVGLDGKLLAESIDEYFKKKFGGQDE